MGNYPVTASGAADNDYTIGYAGRHVQRYPRSPDDHGRSQDEGLRRSITRATASYSGLGQRRHAGQPDHAADGRHHGHCSEPCGRSYSITANGA